MRLKSVARKEKSSYMQINLRKYHEYREVNKNVYCLDFPNRSMTQGWVVFPQKQENLPLEGLGVISRYPVTTSKGR